jgi:hypothetical protein
MPNSMNNRQTIVINIQKCFYGVCSNISYNPVLTYVVNSKVPSNHVFTNLKIFFKNSIKNKYNYICNEIVDFSNLLKSTIQKNTSHQTSLFFLKKNIFTLLTLLLPSYELVDRVPSPYEVNYNILVNHVHTKLISFCFIRGIV